MKICDFIIGLVFIIWFIAIYIGLVGQQDWSIHLFIGGILFAAIFSFVENIIMKIENKIHKINLETYLKNKNKGN